jgi:putative phage-type endonuclease
VQRNEWLTLRKRGLGGSDAAAALGLSRWKSPLELWAEKTGAIPDEEPDETPEIIDWGNILEPIIATQYSKRTCRKTEEVQPGERYAPPMQHPSVPFAFVDLDRRQWPAKFSEDEQRIDERVRMACERDAALLASNPSEGFLEIKNTGVFRRDEWTDEPPLEVQVQVQHAFWVTGAGWASIAVLIGGNRLLWMDVKPNPSFIEQMARKEEAFWRYVETNTAPPVSHPADRDVLATLYKPEKGKSLVLPYEAVEIDEQLQSIHRQEKALKEEKSILQGRVQMMLGDATVGMLPNGAGRFDWSPIHTDSFVMPEKNYRALNRYPRYKLEDR